MARWNIRYGKYWMVQWCFGGWLSFGFHIDFTRRIASTTGEAYGPYIDLHIGPAIFSFGYRPYYSTAISANNIGRGGEVIDYGDSN